MKAPDEPQDQVVEVEKSLLEMVEEMEDSEVYDKLRILSGLTQFQVKIFKGEPKLVSHFVLNYYALLLSLFHLPAASYNMYFIM